MKSKSISLYKRLLAYSRQYLGRIILAVIGSLGVAGVDVATAQLVQPLIDKIVVATC